MTPKDIQDMDYFLHEDDGLDDDFGEDGFYISNSLSSVCYAHLI